MSLPMVVIIGVALGLALGAASNNVRQDGEIAELKRDIAALQTPLPRVTP